MRRREGVPTYGTVLPEGLITHRPFPSVRRTCDRTHQQAEVFRIPSRSACGHDLVSGLQRGGADILRGKLRGSAPLDDPADRIPVFVRKLLIFYVHIRMGVLDLERLQRSPDLRRRSIL